MGCRANFVIVENNRSKAFHDQWAAMGCVYSFAEGPAKAIAAVSGMEEVKELLDWAFAEGGYLIDSDRKVAIVFGWPIGEEELIDEMPPETAQATRRINDALFSSSESYLNLIAENWRGWTITWDQRGVDAFASYLQERGVTDLQTEPPSHPPDTEPPVTIHA